MVRCPTCATQNPDTSRFCGNCAAPLGISNSETETVAAPVPSSSIPPRQASRAPSSAPSLSTADEGRFPPGTLLLDRYRIVALLGRGGMGEVYRATDMKLGQSVAIKFLPEAVAQDERALARFRNEVRIARQVSHPNVCRVYDIGEIEGMQFLSMEYVDGEDLASLLRRIGRVPADKALEIARKLCAGLAAAHDKGVLHRDLKPANIMLDGRGNVLITDFGLAVLSGEVADHEIRHGTPAYMAPEQLSGKEVTAKSDLYSLGLVLYEIFSGKRAFEANTLSELIKLREGSSPVSLTTLVKDVDPAVERVIARCLAPDPRNRPASALAVAAALPGGDPIAAALAAGETPSPDMVAASGETEGMSPRAAMVLLAGIVAGLAAVAWLHAQTNLLEKIPFENSPEALTSKAREIAQKLGYTQRPSGTAGGFNFNDDYARWLPDHDHSNTRWSHVGDGQPALVHFWYRQSPRYFNPGYNLGVSEIFPAMFASGELLVNLDPQGRLLNFMAVPPEKDETKGPAPPTDWNPLFQAAGLDPAKFQPAEPQWVPLVGFDARAAWVGAYPAAPQIPLRVEAASWRGKLVNFQLVAPWSNTTRMVETQTSAGNRAASIIATTILCIIVVGAVLLARLNARQKRSDTRGAARLGGFVFAAFTLQYLFSMYHTPNAGEIDRITAALSEALFQGALIWILYLAIEPFVRRRWPQTIVSWSRALSGSLQDPLVGGDILIGVAFGLFWCIVFSILFLIANNLGDLPNAGGLDALSGVRYLASGFLSQFNGAIVFAFGSFFLLFLLRLVLRQGWLAAICFVGIFVLNKGLTSGEAWTIPFLIVVYAVYAFLLLRYGIVPLIVSVLTADCLLNAPLTLNFSSWYVSSALVSLLVFLAIAFYGFRCVTAGKPVFNVE
jgi:serine/threonine protein kinase